MTVNYSGEAKTIKSKEMFSLGNEFVLTVGYQVSGNEGRKYNTYSSVSFADIELRIFDNASKIELLQNSKIIGRYEGLPTSDSSAYSLKYKNGEISVTKGGEKIISAAVQISDEKTAITLRNGEIYRYSVFKNIVIKIPLRHE